MPLAIARLISRLAGASPELAWRTVVGPALWVGLVLNLPTWWRRQERVWQVVSLDLRWIGALGELLLIGGFGVFLFSLAALAGRHVLRGVGAALLLVSAVCAYYMTRFNVVIGYGVIGAVFTTDHDMSTEVVGSWMLGWVAVCGLVPAVLFSRSITTSGWQTAHWRRRLRCILPLLLAATLAMLGADAALNHVRKTLSQRKQEGSTNLVGVASHTYVPSNWIAGTAMLLGTETTRWWRHQRLSGPAQHFTYQPRTDLQNALVVLVIGETTRSDRMGILGHERDTTPHLRQETHAVAFRGRSCDTSTKLSLACMFVRPEAITPGQAGKPDVIHEDNVFSVFRHLGFHIELFAMQSESGFYSQMQPHSYKLREVIAAEPQNAGKRLDDMLLVEQLAHAVAQHRTGPRLLVLHTKGSHYLYSQRYTREFARWRPECLSTDQICSEQELFNAYDNSVLFVDHTLHAMRQLLADHKALLVYVSDHGESIGANTHFHATPRHIAPADQFRVPLLFWASAAWRVDAELSRRYEALRARAASERTAALDQESVGHHNLFASLLGCAGIDSPDGGVNAKLNLCHPNEP